MTHTEFSALRRCIALSPDIFLSETFSRKPLLSREADLGESFTDLFSRRDANRLLATGLRTSSVRLVRGDQQLGADQFGHRATGDHPTDAPYIDTERIAARLRDGYSLVMRSLHRYHPPLRKFAQELSRELGYGVRINAYITPPSAQAVGTHFDLQDVFVLQVEGEKEWNIRPPVIEKPLSTEDWHQMGRTRREKLLRISSNADSIVLAPGDVLYLPRGYLHDARATDTTSIQLTVAVMTMTRFDLFQHAVRMADRDKWFREAIPAYDGSDPVGHVADLLAEGSKRLRELVTQLSAGDLLWDLSCAQSTDLPPGPVDIFPDSASVPDGNYLIRTGVRYRLVERDDNLHLLLNGRVIVIPKSAGELLTAILSGSGPENGRNIPGISDKTYTQIIRVLYESGVIVSDD